MTYKCIGGKDGKLCDNTATSEFDDYACCDDCKTCAEVWYREMVQEYVDWCAASATDSRAAQCVQTLRTAFSEIIKHKNEAEKKAFGHLEAVQKELQEQAKLLLDTTETKDASATHGGPPTPYYTPVKRAVGRPRMSPEEKEEAEFWRNFDLKMGRRRDLFWCKLNERLDSLYNESKENDAFWRKFDQKMGLRDEKFWRKLKERIDSLFNASKKVHEKLAEKLPMKA